MNKSSLIAIHRVNTSSDKTGRRLTESSITKIKLCSKGVTGTKITYSGLPWDTSRDDDEVSSSQSLLQAIIRRKIAFDFSRGRDVREI